jgi:RNA polymerase sigma factor (TIGR02999 family)
MLSREQHAHTLQPTALVNEVYIKLRRENRVDSDGRTRFVACAAHAMRQLLIDFARRRNAVKRKGVRVDVSLSGLPDDNMPLDDLLSLHAALEKLAGEGPNGGRHARLIELVWFGGLSFTEAAGELGVSRRQAHRDWAWARTWLAHELGED